LLAYNFGIYFVGYLRGTAPTPVISYEFVNDLIAVTIFYVRIIVQGVRLVLMLGTMASLNEFMIFNSIPARALMGPEQMWVELTKTSLTLSGLSYYFLVNLPAHLAY